MTETPRHDGVNTQNLRDFRSLRRSTTDRRIAGVAGGLGRHLDIDPTVIRVLLVVLVFFGGAGLVLYGAAWLLVPEDGQEHGVVTTTPSTRNALLIGAAAVAALLLVGGSWGRFGFPWPLAVFGVVVFLVLVNRPGRGAGSVVPEPARATTPVPSGDGTVMEPSADAPTGTVPPPPPAGPGWVPPQPPVPPAPPRRHGPLLFGFTLALVALALGVLGLFDASGARVVPGAYPALALAVVGVMLVVGAWVGRAGGLVLLGLVAALLLAVSSVSTSWHDVVNGDRHLDATPVSAAAVRSSYGIPAGQVTLDLRRVRDPKALDGRTIDVHAQAGELLVLLPANLGADVKADVAGPGDVSIDGRSSGGIGTHVDQILSDGGDVALVTLNLDLAVGHIEVRQ
ncbi:MAG: PspC domain-containing protein [Nocardioides sp.]